jgi:hypothetical protein
MPRIKNMSRAYDQRDVFDAHEVNEEAIKCQHNTAAKQLALELPEERTKWNMATVVAIGVGVAAAAFLVGLPKRRCPNAVLKADKVNTGSGRTSSIAQI